MNSILQDIVLQKLEEVAIAKRNKPLKSLLRDSKLQPRDFIKALSLCPSPGIIAEIKKASPSKGLIREDFNVAAIAKSYAENGACALSVLTDNKFFSGHADYLALAKLNTELPVLRKDFIIDAYQIHESWALGADCILLIAALLTDAQLADFCRIAQELNMAVLVESHTQEELERSLLLPTPLIGINNRNLHDFKTDIQLSIKLRDLVPEDKIIIAESGINTHEDIKKLQGYGIHSFLVGESLMRAEDIGGALRGLIRA